MNIQMSRFDVSSTVHKTYNNPGSTQKFRDVLELVVNAFLKVASLPKFTRLGLRYIDDCPLPEKSTQVFRSHYDTAYPVTRFSIEDTKAYDFATIVARKGVSVRYAESLSQVNGQIKFILDFDGSVEDLPATDWLKATDNLHEAISEEYFRTIKDPVKDLMRKPKGV